MESSTVSFRPESQDGLAPSGARARFRANLEAIETLRQIQQEQRPATAAEQQVLGRWGGWGAQGLWQVFDEARSEFAADRAQLHQVLSEEEYAAAQRTVINAHYTDPLIGREMWSAVQQLGFDSGRVLEPGCGAGTFIGLAPAGVEAVVVELDPTTAAIATIGGHQVNMIQDRFNSTKWRDRWTIAEGEITKDVLWSTEETRSPLGTISRIEGLTQQIEPHLTKLTSEKADCDRTITDAAKLIGRPFKQSAELTAARAS